MGAVVAKYVFFPPQPCSYDENKPYPVTFIPTKNGKRVPAYYLKAEGSKVHILYSHGNAADIGLMYDFLKLLRDQLNVNVLGYDYIGYGLAQDQGKTSEANCFLSAETAYEYLTITEKVDPSDIIIFGTSLGTGASTYLATKYNHAKIRGVILESPFTSIVRIVSPTPVGRAIDIFDSLKRIKHVKTNVMIIHGDQDQVVPFEHGKTLYEAIPNEYKFPPIWVKGAGHDDIMKWLSLTTYIRNLRDFIFNQEKVKQSMKASGSNSNNNDA